MAGLVFAGIAPHGETVIEEISGKDYKECIPLRNAMIELGKKCKEYNPDTIVVLTPHGLRLKGYNAVYTCEYSRGSLTQNGKTIYEDFKCDKDMALEILRKMEEKKIPVVGANYGALEGRESCIQMDWGALIPLWFLGGQDKVKPEVVMIGPTREIPLSQLVELGEIIAETANESGKKIALLASADQAHAHDPKAIYGYDPAADEYDKQICSIIKENKLEKLLDMDMDLVEKAMPDSLWQMLILYGALKITPMKGKLLCYQLPTYFGMLVASYEKE